LSLVCWSPVIQLQNVRPCSKTGLSFWHAYSTHPRPAKYYLEVPLQPSSTDRRQILSTYLSGLGLEMRYSIMSSRALYMEKLCPISRLQHLKLRLHYAMNSRSICSYHPQSSNSTAASIDPSPASRHIFRARDVEHDCCANFSRR